MKRAIIIAVALLCVALLAYGIFALNQDKAEAPEPQPLETAQPAPTAAPEEEVAQEETPVRMELDYDAIYALHDAQELAVRSQDGELSWGDYFYLLYSQTRQISDYFNQMQYYYGLSMSWNDMAEEDETYAQMAMESVDDVALQVLSIESFLREKQVALTAEDEEQLAQLHQQDLQNACGEGATEEDFDAYLSGIYLSREMYERMNRMNLLYQQGFIQLYGEDGEKLSDEAALAFLQEGGYMAAHHILLLTTDSSGEAMSEEEAEEQRLRLQALAEELRAIEDPAERVARLEELKQEICQDEGGKQTYPHGYTFTPGTMVGQFEAALQELQDYEVSDPVKTDYGYHIIMRLPLAPENLVYGNSPRTARALAANAEYGAALQAKLDAAELHYSPGFEGLDLLQYLKPAEVK